jgi:hypothetical protein
MSNTTTRLFDDEGFTAKDRITRELVFQPLDPHDPVVDHGKVVHLKHIRINLTQSHFTDKGGVSFKDLNTQSYNIINSVWDALAFATGKKKKLSVTGNKRGKAKPKSTPVRRKTQKNGRKGGGNHANDIDIGDAEEEEAMEAEEGEEEEESHTENGVEENEEDLDKINGNDDLRVYIETLLTEDTRQVNGFRIDIFDMSTDGSSIDLVTRGIIESMIASKKIQSSVNVQQKKASNQHQRGKQLPHTITRKYQYTQYNTKELLGGLINKYFADDSLLLQIPSQHIGTKDQKQHFIDRRACLKHNQYEKMTASDFSLYKFYGKEQAMFYFVELDGVCIDQRTRRRYFAPLDKQMEKQMSQQRREEIAHQESRDRLVNLTRDIVADREFYAYPFPKITYRIPNQYLCHEVMSEMILPHRLGSYLYCEEDRLRVDEKIDALKLMKQREKRHQNNARLDDEASTVDGDDDDGDEDGLFDCRSVQKPRDLMSQRELQEPIGIHQTEYEITPSVLQYYNNLLTDDLRRYATAATVPNYIAHSFVSCITNIVQEELQLTINSIDMVKNDLIESQVPIFVPYYRISTKSGVINNTEKTLLLDKRASKDYGLSKEAKERELQKMFSMASLPYFRPTLGKWRPPVATISSAKAMGKPKYDEKHMERDQYLVTEEHNAKAWIKLKRHYYDKNHCVTEGKRNEFNEAKRELIQAMIVEVWDTFFNGEAVNTPNKGIRDDFMRHKNGVIGHRMPVNKCNIQARSYHQYKLWLYGFFSDVCGVNHHFKIMNALYHGKLHSCRYFPPGMNDNKNHIALLGDGMGGKTFRLWWTAMTCPPSAVLKITHMTANALNTEMNFDGYYVVNDELPASLIGAADTKGDAAMDNVRNQWKERLTGGEGTTMAYHQDDEGNRLIKLFKAQLQFVLAGASNMPFHKSDPSLQTRIHGLYVPRSMYDGMGSRAQDKDKAESGKSSKNDNEIIEQHRELHRIYFFMECLVKAGVFGDNRHGLEIEGARMIIDKTLDQLHTAYRIPTNDPRKRKSILELARSMALMNACWKVSTHPKYQALFHDPYDPKKYIGFNPRVAYAIMSEAIVKSDHALDALSTFSCFWGHEYQNHILENIATKKCKLHELREADFVRRDRFSKQPVDAAPLLSAHMAKTMPKKDAILSEEWEINYNYIVIQSKSHEDIHKVLSGAVAELHISENDITKILGDMKKQRIKTDSYVMKNGRLVASGNPNMIADRPVLDYGYDPITKNAAIAISTAFLRQKLPHIFGTGKSGGLIDDLTCFSFRQTTDRPREEGENEEDDMNLHIVDESKKITPQAHQKSSLLTPQHQRLEDALIIERGAPNETPIIAAFKDVMENETYGYTGEYTMDEEDEIMDSYRDGANDRLPCNYYVTSEYPMHLPIRSLFGDLATKYSKLENAITDISLVEKPAVIYLERRRDVRAPIIHNHTTVSPMTRASLSIYHEKSDGDMEVEGDSSVIQENRILAYSNIASIRQDRDLDYIYGQELLERIGHPEPRKNGLLLNFPYHEYIEMVLYNDERAKETGKTIPMLKPYYDVLEKVRTTREMIETELGIKTSRSTTLSQYMKLNVHESDQRTEKVNVQLLKRKRDAREIEENATLCNFMDMIKNYNIPDVGYEIGTNKRVHLSDK